MSTEEIILYDSEQAATYKTGLSGWVSRDGRFFGKDEHMARWSGCSHIKCEEGNIYKKGFRKCDPCRARARDERYQALEFEEYTDQIVVCRDHENYFFHPSDLYDHMRDNGLYKMELIVCEPNYAPYIEDYGIDIMPEDQYIDDVHPELANMLAEVNDYIAKNKPILSWAGGKKRTTATLPETINQ